MKKLVFLGAMALSSALVLGACDDDTNNNEPSKEVLNKAHKYNLEYFEVLTSGSSDTPKVDIAYSDNGKTEHIHTDTDSVYEHILKDGNKKPYLIKDDGDYHIYRPPYMTYSDNDIEGTVESKDEIKK